MSPPRRASSTGAPLAPDRELSVHEACIALDSDQLARARLAFVVVRQRELAEAMRAAPPEIADLVAFASGFDPLGAWAPTWHTALARLELLAEALADLEQVRPAFDAIDLLLHPELARTTIASTKGLD
jgi:hypothetical protein